MRQAKDVQDVLQRVERAAQMCHEALAVEPDDKHYEDTYNWLDAAERALVNATAAIATAEALPKVETPAPEPAAPEPPAG